MRVWICSMVAAVLLGTSLAQAAHVTLMKVVERRGQALEGGTLHFFDSGITLTLRVDGEDLKGARKFGNLAASKAVDDLNTDLAAESGKALRMPKSFENVREPFSTRQPKPDGFDVELRLPTPSKRNAKSIMLVTGSLQVLVGGEKKVAELKPLKQQIGKAIDDPALKAAGVTLMLPRDEDAKDNTIMKINAEFAGNLDTLGEVAILDASGKKLNTGAGWSDSGDKRSISYSLTGPLPDDATMRIELWPGQKTVTIPFEMKDVKLP